MKAHSMRITKNEYDARIIIKFYHIFLVEAELNLHIVVIHRMISFPELKTIKFVSLKLTWFRSLPQQPRHHSLLCPGRGHPRHHSNLCPGQGPPRHHSSLRPGQPRHHSNLRPGRGQPRHHSNLHTGQSQPRHHSGLRPGRGQPHHQTFTAPASPVPAPAPDVSSLSATASPAPAHDGGLPETIGIHDRGILVSSHPEHKKGIVGKRNWRFLTAIIRMFDHPRHHLPQLANQQTFNYVHLGNN